MGSSNRAYTRYRAPTEIVLAGPQRTRSRGYQTEMFEESLKRNIIVTMDTGSGKTHIAILRIRAQLDKGDGKLCWLLVPSIPLGNQQFEVLKSSLPPVNIQFLSGSDYVEKWKDQEIWDGVLELKEEAPTVVVSTHQILLDALTHGFVTIDRIGLLIFDEAHHCVGNHPANRIMRDFYHPNFHRLEVPVILGLTASPIVKAKPNQLRVIESNMNSISRSPILNREELMQYVHHPAIKSVIYSTGPSTYEALSPRFPIDMELSIAEEKKRRVSGRFPEDESDTYLLDWSAGAGQRVIVAENSLSASASQTSISVRWSMPAFRSLLQVYREMDIHQDPHVLQLKSTDPPDEKRIRETIENKSTRSHRQMHGIKKKAEHILNEYGVWATEWYVTVVVKMTLEAADENVDKCALMGWDEAETLYLRDTLKRINLPEDLGAIEGGVTNKVEKLIGVLLKEYHGDEGGKDFSGLVFVQQRVGVSVLAEIIRSHPRSKGVFNVGTLVGAADNDAKCARNIYELTSSKDQNWIIDGFRRGTKNLVISTSVVEEGLDIPACHLVVCFSLPPNLKSFIQRRGRARRTKSTYFLMFEKGSDTEGKIEKLKNLEQEMIAEYLDETRKLKEILDREEDEVDEDGVISDGDNRKYMVQSTGALLTLDSAVPHLQHFCNTLPHTPYTDLDPIFIVEPALPEDEGFYGSEKPLYRAKVLLPNSMPSKVRRAVSKKVWEKKGWAKRDAAFEAYLALHKLEDPLINDNLLPLLINDANVPNKGPSIVSLPKTMDPWESMNWKEGTVIYATPITLKMPNSRGPVEIEILTSVELPCVDAIPIYWTKTETGEVTVGKSRCLGVDEKLLARAKTMTYELFDTVFRTKMKSGAMSFPYLFTWGDIEKWDLEDKKSINALEAYTTMSDPESDIGIVRERNQWHKYYIFRQWRTDISPSTDAKIIERYGNRPANPDQPIIEVVPLSHRRDFLHELATDLEAVTETPILLLPEYCTIDKIPWRYSQFALFLPGVIHRIEIALVAWDLQHTLLAPVDLKSTSNIVTAITTTSARESTSYQRFEFFGDSVIKFLATVNLLDEHPSWHEGNLTTQKSRMVSNSRLSRIAQKKELSKWVITEPFTGLKWSPRYIIQEDGETAKPSTTEKMISTKVLADVVESLIGAAYTEGGYEKASKCASALGLEKTWKPFRTRIDSMITHAVDSPTINIPYLQDLEKLIGYNFKHQALLVEAITHPSCESLFPSYQRLEFLGDALLDIVVLDELFFIPKKLSPTDMHHFRSSVVNGNLLAFLSLGCSMKAKRPKVEQLRGSFEVVTEEREVNLWEFVHLSHPEMVKARRKCLERYEDGLRDKVQVALETGMYYPWVELSPLEADTQGKNKLLSDIIEAILGAVFVDSGGDLESVRKLAERLGILKVLKRFVKDEVILSHPLNRLAEIVASMHKRPVLFIESVENGEFIHSAWFEGEELATARSSSRVESKIMVAEACLKILEKVAKEEAEVEAAKGTGVDIDVEMDLS